MYKGIVTYSGVHSGRIVSANAHAVVKRIHANGLSICGLPYRKRAVGIPAHTSAHTAMYIAKRTVVGSSLVKNHAVIANTPKVAHAQSKGSGFFAVPFQRARTLTSSGFTNPKMIGQRLSFDTPALTELTKNAKPTRVQIPQLIGFATILLVYTPNKYGMILATMRKPEIRPMVSSMATSSAVWQYRMSYLTETMTKNNYVTVSIIANIKYLSIIDTKNIKGKGPVRTCCASRPPSVFET